MKLDEGEVKVTAGRHRFSFPAVLLNNQDLGELELALRDAEDPVEELAVQLGYLTEDHDGSQPV